MQQKYIKTNIIRKPRELNQHSDQFTGRAPEGLRFDSLQGQETALFSTESGLVLGSTQSRTEQTSGALFHGIKRPASKACVPPPFSAEVLNEWNYTSTPHSMHRDNFTFVCITVKTHFVKKWKLCFHSGGDTGFWRQYSWADRRKTCSNHCFQALWLLQAPHSLVLRTARHLATEYIYVFHAVLRENRVYSVYSTNTIFFVMKTQCVFCETGT